MMKTLLKTVAASAFALVSGACALSAQEYPKLKLTYAHVVPEGSGGAKFDTMWADRVHERSGGNIEIEIFWAGSMGSATEIPDLVGSGAVDFGSTALGYFPDQFPLSGVTGNVQRTFATPEDAYNASMDIYALPAVDEELARSNVLVLYTTTANPYNLTCTKPIRTMADLKGTRIRANGKYPPIFFNSLGAAPQTVAFVEMYEALEKGLIECSWMSHDLAINYKLDEVAKYAIDLNLGAVAFFQMLANRDRFQSLPQNVQDLMLDVAQEVAAEEHAYLKEVFEKTIKEDMPAHGMEYVHFEDIDTFLETEPNSPALWAKDIADAGMPEAAEQILDVLQGYRAELVK